MVEWATPVLCPSMESTDSPFAAPPKRVLCRCPGCLESLISVSGETQAGRLVHPNTRTAHAHKYYTSSPPTQVPDIALYQRGPRNESSGVNAAARPLANELSPPAQRESSPGSVSPSALSASHCAEYKLTRDDHRKPAIQL